MSVSILQDSGKTEIELRDMELHREAADKKLTFRQLVNKKFPTTADSKHDTFTQMCHSAGIRFKRNPETGQPASTIKEVLNGAPSYEAANQTGGTYTSAPAAPDSRILFMPAIMELIEDKLMGKHDQITAAFNSIIGRTDYVASNRLEQPVVSYQGKGGPEDFAFQRISQNTNPPIMLSLTASDTTRTIPTMSVGMELSNQALDMGIDLVALTMARFLRMTDYNEAIASLGKILNGDSDAAVTSMSAGTSSLAAAGRNTYIDALDSSITGNGIITHEAWMKFLYQNSLTMTKTNFVCDFNTYMALDTRSGRPDAVVTTADGGNRMDVPINVSFPTFNGGSIDGLVLPNGSFTANTIMAFDKEYAIAKTISTTADYDAMEDLVMRRSKALRLDRGWIMYRQYDDAFDVLTVTTTP